MGQETLNGQLGRALYWAIRDGKAIENIPGLVKRVIENQCWQSLLIEETGEVKEFASFVEYVTTSPPEGLGTDIETLWSLCRNDIEAQAMIDEATKQGRGNPTGHNQYKNGNDNIVNISSRPVGNTRQAGLRRLSKSRPDLHTRILAHDEISVNAAMVEAGFRPKTLTIPVDPRRAAQVIKRQFSQDQIEQLIKQLMG
jgi:hypothetical protein